MSGCRSEAGELFQIVRPTTAKLLSPSRVFVLGTVITFNMSRAKPWVSGVRDQLTVVGQVRGNLTSQRLVDKSGQLVVDPLFYREPVQTIRRTGEMWLRRLAPVRKRAAAF